MGSSYEALQSAIAPFSEWIGSILRCNAGDAAVLELEFPIEHLVLPHLLPDVPFRWPEAVRSLAPDWPVVSRIELPPGHAAHISMTPHFARTANPGRHADWYPSWEALPVALWFDDAQAPVVAFRVPYVKHTGDPEEYTAPLWLVNRADAAAVLARLGRSLDGPYKRIEVVGGRHQYLPVGTYSWDDVVLDPATAQAVREDFEAFLGAAEWFSRNRLPYRRGYLFYGAPGNGKTSALRIMAAHPQISAFTIDLGDENNNNRTLTQLFERAARHAPALVIFEDLDRTFALNAPEERFRETTLQHLLNCLDGISSPSGVIVVATANHPEQLDPAILKRPGRFDRVIEFRAPAFAERQLYFARQSALHLQSAELELAAQLTSGFSFAQLREAYIQAGQSAFSRRQDVCWSDLAEGISQIRAGVQGLSRSQSRRTVGFETWMEQAD